MPSNALAEVSCPEISLQSESVNVIQDEFEKILSKKPQSGDLFVEKRRSPHFCFDPEVDTRLIRKNDLLNRYKR
jgi:hypothetical protein